MDETLHDLAADFEELLSLATSAQTTLVSHRSVLEAGKAVYERPTYAYLYSKTEDLCKTYGESCRELGAILSEQSSWTHSDIPRLIQCKKEYADLIRVLQNTLASVRTAGNWQSPSFDSSCMPQAGTRAGRVEPNTNDYLRDYNLDETAFGSRFVQEYVDHPLRLAPVVYFMSSCMAAFTTALVDIHSRANKNDTVLMGKGSYFQNKLVAEKIFPGKIEYIDESDTEALIARAKVLQPAALLLDTICGTDSLAVLNMPLLMPGLSKVLSRKTTLVLDNTGLATYCQPLAYLPHNPLGVQLVVVASLSKYYECGFDRVNGGVLWAPVGSALNVGQSRMHLGTIMPDTALCALPTPNRKLFDLRLARISRNAHILAERLERVAGATQSTVSHIVYPGLSRHESNEWVKGAAFQGGSLVIAFKEKYQTVRHCESFAERIMERVRACGVDLVAGTGFGFNTTRLYYTTKYASSTMLPFVRLSAGTETLQEITLLADAIESVIANT